MLPSAAKCLLDLVHQGMILEIYTGQPEKKINQLMASPALSMEPLALTLDYRPMAERQRESLVI
jgi:hypothetical protein